MGASLNGIGFEASKNKVAALMFYFLHARKGERRA